MPEHGSPKTLLEASTVHLERPSHSLRTFSNDFSPMHCVLWSFGPGQLRSRKSVATTHLVLLKII